MKYKIVLLMSLFVFSSVALDISTDKEISKSSEFIMPTADKTLGYIEILDEKALNFINTDSQISVRGEGFAWTEGPVWVEDGHYLLFTDTPKNLIRKYDVKNGTRVYLKNSGFAKPSDKGPGANGLLLNNQGKLVLMQTGDRQVALMNAPLENPKASYLPLATNFKGMRLNGTNDGVFHSDGSLYFTDPKIALDATFDNEGILQTKKSSLKKLTPRVQQTPFAGVYRLDTKGNLKLLDKTVTVPNGIGLSPDEKTLYVAVSDKKSAIWLTYDVEPNGSTTNKRLFYDATSLVNQNGEQGLPDGMAVHSSGVIFATGPGGVWVFDPKGKVLAKIRTGQNTSNCTLTFDESYLFITADDFLLSVPIKKVLS
jgi:gluconolactonase